MWQLIKQLNWVALKRVSPLVWGFALLLLALLIIQIPIRFFQLLAILPGVFGTLFIYQAIFRNKY